jgi:hypothetical protein
MVSGSSVGEENLTLFSVLKVYDPEIIGSTGHTSLKKTYIYMPAYFKMKVVLWINRVGVCILK